jgi:ornithine decarboxylase
VSDVSVHDEEMAALGARAVAVHSRLGGEHPVLAIDPTLVAARAAQLSAALPRARLLYAVKANPHPEVLAAVRAAGIGAEVASLTEARAAVAAGWSPADLWCTRLHLHPNERARLLELGLRSFVVEDDDAAAACGRSDLLVRVDVGLVGECAWPLAGRDGLAPADAAALAARWPNVRGPAFHVGSQQHDPRAWGDVAAAVVRSFGSADVVDVGGGFPAAGIVGTAGPADWAGAGAHLGRSVPDRVEVIAEPGRALVADAGALVTTVIAVTTRHGERWAHLDVGVYTGLAEADDEAMAWRSWSPDADGTRVPWRVAGPSCDATDVLARSRPWWLPDDLRVGARLVLFGTGAYTTAYLPTGVTGFNGLPIPPTVVL